MERRNVNPWTWQDEMGFAQANEVSGERRVLVCSGQGSVDDEGRPVHAGDMRAQVTRTLDNLETVLREADMGLSDVVRLNHYTTDVDAFFGAMDLIAARMEGDRPSSTLLGVTRLAFPEMLVEIEATAMA
jgi:enamine deaminase RidA (YjgF/YER057c/UK114 family)